MLFESLFGQIGSILAVSGAGGVASMLFMIPLAEIYSLVALLFSGAAANLAGAAAIEIYPTALR